MEFDLPFIDIRHFVNLIGATILLGAIMLQFIEGRIQKRAFIAFSVFYFIYNGFGVTYAAGVADSITGKYVAFYLALGLSYALFLKLFLTPSRHVRQTIMPYLKRIVENRTLIYGIVIAYFATFLFHLIYPEMKLDRIIFPPAPRVADQFAEGLQVSISGRFNPLTKIVDNIEYLLYPFYLIALYRFRHKPVWLFSVLIIPQYFYYCELSYINRARILEILFMYGAIIWIFNRPWRKYLMIGGLILLPMIPIGLVQYAHIRSERELVEVTVIDAVEFVVYSETIMPTFSKKIYRTDKRINKKNYLIWMFTLPIPKVIIGAVPRVTAGGEMSEILLEKKEGDRGYFVLLAGLLNESVYIYGNKLFFLHAIMIGIILAFAIRLVEYDEFLVPMQLVLLVIFCYVLNRAGIGSLLSQILNRFMSFYLLIFGIYLLRLTILPNFTSAQSVSKTS